MSVLPSSRSPVSPSGPSTDRSMSEGPVRNRGGMCWAGGVLAALALGPVTATAARLTDVADAADEGNPYDVRIDTRFTFGSRGVRINREYLDVEQQRVRPVPELDYARSTLRLDTGLQIGLFHDLELRFDLPIGLTDRQSWDFAVVNGQSVRDTSTLQNNALDANGQTGTASGPFFRCTDGSGGLNCAGGASARSGLMDPSFGLQWAILNGERDAFPQPGQFPVRPRTATWVVGLQYTAPLAKVWNPLRPSENPDALGEGLHKLTAHTSFSKRMGVADPFVRVWYTYQTPSNLKAFDNCDLPAEMQTAVGRTTCAGITDGSDTYWKNRTQPLPPQRAGFLLGTEMRPTAALGQTDLAFVVDASTEYVAKGRGYNDATDVIGKLTMQDAYLRFQGRLGMDVRFSPVVHLLLGGYVGGETPRFLTVESVGEDRFGATSDDVLDPALPADGVVSTGTVEQNPNYDFRLDTPGRRLIATGVLEYGGSLQFSLQF